MVELRDVSKSYDGKLIFEDVNLTLKEGTCTAFVGHNGCGKSTLLKVTSGLITLNSGKITGCGKKRMAYVPERFPATNMTARKYLLYMAKIDGVIPKKEMESLVEKLSHDFYLNDLLDIPMKNLSKGSLQKVGVIQAILSKPEILFLDEPLSGQDFDSQIVFIKKIKEIKKAGTIVVLSAHEQNLIDELADEVYTISDYKLMRATNRNHHRYVIEVSDVKASDYIIGDHQKVNFEEGLFANNLKKVDSEEGLFAATIQKVYSEEALLASNIQKIQREGGHIVKIYEDDSID